MKRELEALVAMADVLLTHRPATKVKKKRAKRRKSGPKTAARD